MRNQLWLLAAWSFAGLIILTSLSLILLYGIAFNHVKSGLWFSGLLIAIVYKSVVIDPIRISVVALLNFCETKKPPPDYKFQKDFTAKDANNRRLMKRRLDYLIAEFRNEKWSQRHGLESQQSRASEELIIDYNKIMIDLLILIFYLIALLMIVLGSRDSMAYYSTRYVRHYFLSGKYNGLPADMVLTDRDLIDYINKTIIVNLNQGRMYNGDNISDSHGWLNDKTVKILGVARLRQHRIRRQDCNIYKKMQKIVQRCSGSFHPDHRDKDDYIAKWKSKMDFSYSKEYWRIIDPWKYKTSLQSRTLPVFGDLYLYPGGGYIANLGRNYNNSQRVLQFLTKNKWIDEKTGVLFVEFTLYSANSNLFNVVTIVAERNPFGSYRIEMKVKSVPLLFVFSYMPWYAIMAFLALIVMITVFFYRLILSTISVRIIKGFWSNPWNIMDSILIVLSCIVLVLFCTRNLYVVRLLDQLDEFRNNQFVSFYYAAFCDDFYTWVAALLVCLATARLWKILHFALVFRVLTRTLYRSAISIASTMLLIFVFLIAFAIIVHLVNGKYSFRFVKFASTFSTLLAFNAELLEEFDPKEMQFGGKLFGILLYGLQTIFINICFLNLLVTISCFYFSEVKEELNKVEAKNYTFWSFLRDEFVYNWQNIFYGNKTSNESILRLRGGGGRKSKYSAASKSELAGTKLTRVEYTNEKAALVNKIIDTQMDYVEKFIDEQFGNCIESSVQEKPNDGTEQTRKTQDQDSKLNVKDNCTKNDKRDYGKRVNVSLKAKERASYNSIRTV